MIIQITRMKNKLRRNFISEITVDVQLNIGSIINL